MNILITLMNTSELMPGGGFFGSYLTIHIKWFTISRHIHDTYRFTKDMNIYILPPDRAQTEGFLVNDKISLLSANQFGFTNLDGESICQLYQKAYGKKLDMVVFVSYDILQYFFNNFELLRWQRECINVLGIKTRKKGTSPKDNYIKNLKNLVRKNILGMIYKGITKCRTILHSGYINIYLPSASQYINTILSYHHLSIIPDASMIRVFEYNIGMNKLSKFIDKKCYISDGVTTQYYRNNAHISLKKLTGDRLFLDLIYSLSIPDTYKQFLQEFELQEGIEFDMRDLSLLGLYDTARHKIYIWLPPDTSVEFFPIEHTIYQTPYGICIVCYVVLSNKKSQMLSMILKKTSSSNNS